MIFSLAVTTASSAYAGMGLDEALKNAACKDVKKEDLQKIIPNLENPNEDDLVLMRNLWLRNSVSKKKQSIPTEFLHQVFLSSVKEKTSHKIMEAIVSGCFVIDPANPSKLSPNPDTHSCPTPRQQAVLLEINHLMDMMDEGTQKTVALLNQETQTSDPTDPNACCGPNSPETPPKGLPQDIIAAQHEAACCEIFKEQDETLDQKGCHALYDRKSKVWAKNCFVELGKGVVKGGSESWVDIASLLDLSIYTGFWKMLRELFKDPAQAGVNFVKGVGHAVGFDPNYASCLAPQQRWSYACGILGRLGGYVGVAWYLPKAVVQVVKLIDIHGRVGRWATRVEAYQKLKAKVAAKQTSLAAAHPKVATAVSNALTARNLRRVSDRIIYRVSRKGATAIIRLKEYALTVEKYSSIVAEMKLIKNQIRDLKKQKIELGHRKKLASKIKDEAERTTETTKLAAIMEETQASITKRDLTLKNMNVKHKELLEELASDWKTHAFRTMGFTSRAIGFVGAGGAATTALSVTAGEASDQAKKIEHDEHAQEKELERLFPTDRTPSTQPSP